MRENQYRELTVYLEKEKFFLGFPRWKVIKSETVVDYYEVITDPVELRQKTIKVAQSMIDVYTRENAVEAAKKAVLDTFTPREAL